MQGVSSEDKAAMLAGYGVESSKDLNLAQLVDIICKLEGHDTEDGTHHPLNKYRKRVFAAGYAWLKAIDNEHTGDADYVKAICCRMTGCKSFNKIEKQQLINLYNGFIKMKKDMQAVEAMTLELLTQKK
jgi:hypothetical protein